MLGGGEEEEKEEEEVLSMFSMLSDLWRRKERLDGPSERSHMRTNSIPFFFFSFSRG